MLGLAGLLAMAGCAATPPAQFYQLQQGNPGLPQADRGVAVLLGPLKLADYLQRETLVQRQGDDTLVIAQQARWVGSLQDDVAQLLLRQLAGRLDSSRLALYPDRVGFKPEAQLLVSIGRMDSGPFRPAVLEAQWRLLDGAGKMLDSRVVRLEEPHNGELTDQVRAQSQLLQQLAGQLAGAVQAMPRPAAAAPTPPPRRAVAPRQAEPRIPQAAPLPAPAAEVYRF
ncbi:ABC-type transport auxiliary lipoprotein family protein [Pseudomonas stutzeri]|nr:ABC-type transport auxiliary lipoprotein family protein [Stutzerimonas stutzeri]